MVVEKTNVLGQFDATEPVTDSYSCLVKETGAQRRLEKVCQLRICDM